jgi:hypothetical protein
MFSLPELHLAEEDGLSKLSAPPMLVNSATRRYCLFQRLITYLTPKNPGIQISELIYAGLQNINNPFPTQLMFNSSNRTLCSPNPELILQPVTSTFPHSTSARAVLESNSSQNLCIQMLQGI